MVSMGFLLIYQGGAFAPQDSQLSRSLPAGELCRLESVSIKFPRRLKLQ